MQKTKIILAISVTILVTLACNALLPLPTQTSVPTQGDVPLTEAEVPRVDVNVAKAAFDSGEAIIVDVRSQSAYDASHVAGSLFIPLGTFETDIKSIDLPKDQWIITYCT